MKNFDEARKKAIELADSEAKPFITGDGQTLIMMDSATAFIEGFLACWDEIEANRVEPVVSPKIVEGFKIKYRGNIYNNAAIKSNGTIAIYTDNGNFYTDFDKCEIQL